MKRLNLFLGAAALVAVGMTASPAAMNAQENGNRDENGKIVRGPYQTNRFGDNIFIGVGGGVNFLFQDDYSPAVGVSVDANIGKWFTPTIGARIGYQGINSNVYSETASVLGSELDTDKEMYLQKFGYMYVHGDFLWNVSNAIGGYKQTRFWDFVPYATAGFYRSYGLDDVDFANNELAVGVGLLHNLRMTERLDLIIDMRALVVNGDVHAANGGVALIPSVTAGLAVDLGYPGFVRSSTVYGELAAVSAAEIDALAASVAAMEVANEVLGKDNQKLADQNRKLSNENRQLRNTPQFDAGEFYQAMGPATFYFEIGKAKLGEKELQHLDYIAKNIIEKVNQQTKVLITVLGTADASTGSARKNAHLSEARGKYVFDILTSEYGISPERLTVKSEVVKVTDKPEMSRAVVIDF